MTCAFNGQEDMEDHIDAASRYLNVLVPAQSARMAGTIVKGAPKVELGPMELQLFYSNRIHRQPPAPKRGVRRAFFLSFAAKTREGLRHPEFKKAIEKKSPKKKKR